MNNTILIPRNIEDRKQKYYEHILKILGKETINGDLKFEEYMLDIPNNLIKVKVINGNLDCYGLGLDKLPKWFLQLTINGNFTCSLNNLISLENSPHIINGNFYCSNNYFRTLENGPKVVNNYFCKSRFKLKRPTDCIIKESCNIYYSKRCI